MMGLKNSSKKTKAAFILAIVMLIIILSTFNTLRNAETTNENINAIYKDRLIVSTYIFHYANELNLVKANTVKNNNDNEKADAVITSIHNIKAINLLYHKTVLTPKEKEDFGVFIDICAKINKQAQGKQWQEVEKSADQALGTLELLSKIQVDEAKLQLENANKTYNQYNMLAQLEIALLIVLGVAIIYLLLTKRHKRVIKIPEGPSLN
ncbi:MCP four helix bundle domain-containing protein [Flavobacterium sp. ALJ2]|uniref:MCP four helix bundle domain-containing protein n=1 Tax=Flavobacterium sp. ALJ2 TaxID=2786960 RepID=UPI00189F7F15|nr:MCP four helix bundle domain-containing protein [Flavobacterium sp. ALJ2]MBF7091570.1 MCP four helix bundle domain-containing protein [Flavobacterium sp. ALJ2]